MRDHARDGAAQGAPDQAHKKPPTKRGATLGALQGAVGNRAVAQLLAAGAPTVQRSTPTPTEAANSHDADKVSDVPAEAWSSASVSNEDRRNGVLAMLAKTIMFPWNDTTVARILNSYPDRTKMTALDIDVVRRASERGSIKGPELSQYSSLANEFDITVAERARQNVAANLTSLDEMSKQYGLGREAEGGASGIPSAMDELQMTAGRVADARRILAELRTVQVGWKPLDPNLPVLPSDKPELFDPLNRPDPRLNYGGTDQRIVPWDKVKESWDAVEFQVAKMMAANPALYVLAATPALDQRLQRDDDRLQYGKSALGGFDTAPPDQAKRELTAAHDKAKAALLKVQGEVGLPGDPITRSNVDTGSMDELGLRVSEYPRFDSPFARWATRDWQTKQQTHRERIASIIDFGTAVLLVGATIGTMGGAAAVAAGLTGVAAVGAVASAGVRISNAVNLENKSTAGFDPKNKLTSDAKVMSAELDAAIGTATAILAIVAAAKGLSKLGGLFRSSSVAEDLARLDKLRAGKATEVVRTSIRETGVLSTSQQAGFENQVDRLLKYLPAGCEEALEVEKVSDLLRKGLVPNVKGSLWRPDLKGVRRRLTIEDLKTMDKSGKRFYTSRTGNLDAVMNRPVQPTTLPPELRANATAPEGVYFWATLEGLDYGPYCFVVDAEELGYVRNPKPGEFISDASYGTGTGAWFHIDDLRTARGK